MEGKTAALFFGALIVSLGLIWFFTGGPALVAGILKPVEPAIVPATLPATTAKPVVTISPAATIPALPSTPQNTPAITPAPVSHRATQPEKTLSADQVRDHFLDIAYSSTNRLERLNYTESHSRVTISLVSGSESDKAGISDTAKDFNAVSKHVKISEMPKDGYSGDIIIKFLPEAGLDAVTLNDIPSSGPFNESLTTGELKYEGVIAAKIMRGTIYINGDLPDQAQNHIIARSLMYEMGLTGETTEYEDSLFYSGENTNTKLSTADKKAIALLYEAGLANGMTLEDLKKVMYIP